MRGGACYDIINHSIDEHEICYTAFILEEFINVFKDNFHYPEFVIKQFVQFIHKFFIKGDTAGAIDNICRDPDDNQILADAAINKIEAIITGDNDLLDLGNYKGIKIISPREYWSL